MARTREQINEYNRKWRAENPEQTKRAWQRQQLNNPAGTLIRAAKQRAKKRGLEFNIDYEDVVVPKFCPILGIPLIVGVGSGYGGNQNSPSLDRIDNSKGYIKGNVQVISHLANSMKSTADKETLIKFANWILKEAA